MPDLLTEPRRLPVARPRASVAFLLVVAVALAVGFAARLAPTPARFVPQISIVNPLPYLVETEVSTPARDGWMPIGAVEPDRAQAFGEVFDLGSRWAFRFSYAGIDGGEVVARRSDLSRARWRVIVPPEVGSRFEAAGLPPRGGR